MRSDWVERDVVRVILALLMPSNQLAVQMSLRYGMRIGDVLATKRGDVENGNWTYTEQKTGKKRRVTVSPDFQAEILANSGRIYVFEHRTDWRKHRTRQAVYKDIKRVAKLVHCNANFTPHSARKIYAVDRFKTSNIARVQRLLNHSSESVTMIYALADEITGSRGLGGRNPPLK